MTAINSFLRIFVPRTLWGEYDRYAQAKRRWKEMMEESK